MPTLTDEKIDIKEYVDRAVKLYRELMPLERKRQELDQIKAVLRDEANGKDIDFKGTGSNLARVEQKPDTITRVVAEEDVLFVAKTAGPNLTDLFTLHPSKGQEKSFELNVLKVVGKRIEALKLIGRLTVAATPWVRLS
jgi:hypothetical protein